MAASLHSSIAKLNGADPRAWVADVLGAATRDGVDAGVVAQPSPDLLRLAVRQDIDGTVAFEIDDERAVALAIAERSHGVMSAG